MFTISVHPRSAVEAGLVHADALISIKGSSQADPVFDTALFGGRILRLSFDDIPNPTWIDHRGTMWVGPLESHVRQALAFGQSIRDASGQLPVSIAVQCEQGKSRSAAIALALLSNYFPLGDEAKAVTALLANDDDEQICCNPGIVRMTDNILGRSGAIETALAAACSRFVTWRRWWHQRGCLDM